MALGDARDLFLRPVLLRVLIFSLFHGRRDENKPEEMAQLYMFDVSTH